MHPNYAQLNRLNGLANYDVNFHAETNRRTINIGNGHSHRKRTRTSYNSDLHNREDEIRSMCAKCKSGWQRI